MIIEPDDIDGAISDRRLQVLTMRLRRVSQRQIAQALNVTQATISRDLDWIRDHWVKDFGPPGAAAGLKAHEEIGEAVALFADVEYSALRDFSQLQPKESRGRNACLRTALLARQMRLNLLQDLGFIDRQVGTVALTWRADVVRDALREEGLLAPELALIEGDVEESVEDEVDRWLRHAG